MALFSNRPQTRGHDLRDTNAPVSVKQRHPTPEESLDASRDNPPSLPRRSASAPAAPRPWPTPRDTCRGVSGRIERLSRGSVSLFNAHGCVRVSEVITASLGPVREQRQSWRPPWRTCAERLGDSALGPDGKFVTARISEVEPAATRECERVLYDRATRRADPA